MGATINSDGTVDCVTYIQACQNKFGPVVYILVKKIIMEI